MTLKLDKDPIELDANQMEAVEHFEGPALVVAGPGSGKTTVIKERILHLIRNHNVNPEEILAIAFNKAAVAELEERILAELNSNHGYPKIRTLHGFGIDIITENYERAGFRQIPEILTVKIDEIIAQERTQIERDASTTSVAIYKIKSKRSGRCYIGQTINPDRRRKEHFDHSSNDRLRQAIRSEGETEFRFEVLERVPGREANRREAYWIAFYRNREGVFNRADPLRVQYSNQLILEMFCQHFEIPYKEHLDRDPDFENLRDRFNDIKETVMRAKRQVTTGVFDPTTLEDRFAQAFAVQYETLKTEANAVDFEDMIIRAANLLETCPDLQQTYCAKYPYLLVDEFQDIAPADFRLISLLSENLFAVGDDDQAIYGFRGGDSKIMLAFAAQQNVSKYEITRNYRSTSTIVVHARALIEKNTHRISKNLRPQNPMQQEIKIIGSTPETVETSLLSELRLPEETAILTRTNDEIEKIEEILGNQSSPIKVSTIYKAKGKEWEKVILIVNALDVWDNGNPYINFPHTSNEITEERRVFYVAMTRAKQELVVLGGNCQFISEFQNVSPIEIAKLQISQTKEELEKTLNEILAALETKLRTELEEATKAALVELKLRLKKEVEKIKLALPQQLKSTNHAFLEGLIPILDDFESFTKNLPITVESNGALSDLAVFTERIQLAHTQLIRLSENHGLKQIQTLGEIFDPTYHEKILPTIHSDDIPADEVIREERRGYLLHDRVIRKAEVVVSKGQNIRIPERLDQIVEIYLNRLIASKFGPKYDLDKPMIKRKMAKYLSELDDESLKKINSTATIDTTQYIKEQPLGNYCVGQVTTHMCTDITFRNFWKYMWEVVKQSKKI